jgi:hypothetical protein
MMQTSLVIIYNWIRLINNLKRGMTFSNKCNLLNATENIIYTKVIFSNTSTSVYLVKDCFIEKNRDSTVGTATGYGLNDRGVGVRVLMGARIFTSLSSPDLLWGSFLGNKAAGA